MTRRVVKVAALLCAGALAALIAGSGIASAGTSSLFLTVNLTSDESDANTGDLLCDVDTGTVGSQCTLRAAIEQVNADPGSDLDFIDFEIPGEGVHRIAPSDYLPAITHRVSINGYTQTGASPNTKGIRKGDNAVLAIELTGKNVTNPFDGRYALTVESSAAVSTIRGLTINRWPVGGILVKGQTTILGNFIGTNPAGTKDRGNEFDGVFGFGGGATIGSSDPADRNIISANGDSGITTNPPMTIQGNYIGTAADGVSPLGNEALFHDAAITLASGNNVIGGLGNAANVIAFDEGDGMDVLNAGTVAWISRNRIFGNEGIGIDLGDNGPTPNDQGDLDTGANGLLNFPILKSATTGGGHTKITGKYKGYEGVAPYGVELFANPPHTRQAARFIGSVHIETDASGKAKFKFKTKRPIAPGQTITATATDDGGQTSELSPRVRVKNG